MENVPNVASKIAQKTVPKAAMVLLLTASMVAAQVPTDTPEAHVALARTAAGEDYQNLFNFLCAAPGARGAGRGAAGAGAGVGGQRGTGGPGAGVSAGPQAGPGTGPGPGAAAVPRGQVGPGAGAPVAGPGAPAGPGVGQPANTTGQTGQPAGQRAGAPRGGGQRGTPDRSTWYAEPVKVFDNFYFVGQTEYSVWAITTSEGIIVVDTIFDYSVEEEVDGGLKKLGLDPSKIKYAIVTHPHPDHHGGAKFLQDKYGTRIIMSPGDWDALDRTTGTRPKRDMEATDGQKLTLGDTTLTLYITPGHTPGTISLLIPVKDGSKSYLGAMWGGTGLNADRESLTNYVASAKRFSQIAKSAGADILLSNHTDWDGAKVKLPLVAKRTSGGTHPFVVGNDSTLRYLKVAEECATSRLLRLP